MRKSFTVLAWQDSAGTFFPAGAQRTISCDHINEGNYGLALNGQITKLPTSTVPIGFTGTDFQHQVASIHPGTLLSDPTAYTNSSFKVVTRVKDLSNNNVTYVDAADYLAKFGDCNKCCTPINCTPILNVRTTALGTTTATVAWDASSQATVYEYVNVIRSGSCVTPAGTGTITTATSVSFTGLTGGSVYCFAVRQRCSATNFSAWTLFQYTTVAP